MGPSNVSSFREISQNIELHQKSDTKKIDVTQPRDIINAKVGNLSLLVFADKVKAEQNLNANQAGRIYHCLSSFDYEITEQKTKDVFSRFIDKLGNAFMGRGFITSDEYINQVKGSMDKLTRQAAPSYQDVTNYGKKALEKDLSYEKANEDKKARDDYSMFLTNLCGSRLSYFRNDIKTLAKREKNELCEQISKAATSYKISWADFDTKTKRTLGEEFRIFAEAVRDSGDKEAIQAFTQSVLERADAKSFWKNIGIEGFKELDSKLKN